MSRIVNAANMVISHKKEGYLKSCIAGLKNRDKFAQTS